MKTVYLCGPINGCTDTECKSWREEVKQILSGECHFLDPMDRDYRGMEEDCYRQIVEGDIQDIETADILFVHAPSASWGTAMETFFAYLLGKTVIMVVPREGRISPWQRYHTHEIHTDHQSAIQSLRRRL